MMKPVVVVFIGLMLGACPASERADSDAPIDAGTDAGSIDEGANAEPTSASWSCPDGWRKSADDSETERPCEPWPEAGQSECQPDEAHYPGKSGCEKIGSECPEGDFPDDVPNDAVFVLAGATSGNGSEGRPFGNIQDAIDAAAPGGTVIVGKGRYDAWIYIAKDLTLRGTCVAETILTDSEPASSNPTLTVLNGAHAVLSDFSIADSEHPGLAVLEANSHLEATGVLVDNVAMAGLVAVESGRFEGRQIVVRNTKFSFGGGYGLQVDTGASMHLQSSVFERNAARGMVAEDEGTRLILQDVAVLKTDVDDSGDNGAGIHLSTDATATLERVVIEDNHLTGLFVAADAAAEGTDVVVRNTQTVGSRATGGQGINVLQGGSVDLEKVWLSDNHEVGVASSESRVVLRDAWIENTQPGGVATSPGVGFFADEESSAELARVVLRGNHELGLSLRNSTVVADDIEIDGVLPSSFDGLFGRGIAVEQTARMSGARWRIVDTYDAAITVISFSTLEASDVTIRATASEDANGVHGRGIELVQGAEVTITGLTIEDSHEIGFAAAGEGTRAEIDDALITNTRSELASGGYGRGVSIRDHANVSFRNVRITENRNVGVLATDHATLALLNATVSNVGLPDCAVMETCAEQNAAIGISAWNASNVSATDFLVENAGLCGVQVGSEASFQANDGFIRGHDIGICIQDAEFDLAALASQLVLEGNEINATTTELPLPEARDSLTSAFR